MEFVAVADCPRQEGPLVAYNLYHCAACLIVCKQDVRDHPGLTWLLPDNSIISEPAPPKTSG